MHHSSEERNAMRAMLLRAAVVSSNDAGAQQPLALSALASERLTNIVHVQPFGLSSNPPVGGEGLIVSAAVPTGRCFWAASIHNTGR
jgi:phage gp45-like